MSRSITRRLGLLAAAALLAGCGGDAAGPKTGAAEARLRFSAEVGASAVAEIVVEVAAADLAQPLAFNLPVRQGVAEGAVTVPAGRARTLTARAFDARGAETHRGARTVDVAPGTNQAVRLTLLPFDGGAPIPAAVGSFTVTVSPDSAVLAPGDTLRLRAQVRDADGVPVDAAVAWGTLDAARAGVDRDGLVAARDTGAATIVAVYAGAAGSARLSVTPR